MLKVVQKIFNPIDQPYLTSYKWCFVTNALVIIIRTSVSHSIWYTFYVSTVCRQFATYLEVNWTAARYFTHWLRVFGSMLDLTLYNHIDIKHLVLLPKSCIFTKDVNYIQFAVNAFTVNGSEYKLFACMQIAKQQQSIDCCAVAFNIQNQISLLWLAK